VSVTPEAVAVYGGVTHCIEPSTVGVGHTACGGTEGDVTGEYVTYGALHALTVGAVPGDDAAAGALLVPPSAVTVNPAMLCVTVKKEAQFSP
jgi:hypothetical protein